MKMKLLFFAVFFALFSNTLVFAQEMFVTATRLRFRDMPNGDIIDLIPYGTSVTVIESTNGWACIEYYQTRGWVSLTYLREGTPLLKKMFVSTTSLNIRNTSDGIIIGKLPNRAEVTVIIEHHGWSYIRYDNQRGWVSLKYLEP